VKFIGLKSTIRITQARIAKQAVCPSDFIVAYIGARLAERAIHYLIIYTN